MSDTWSSIQAHKKQLDSLRERLQRRRKQDPLGGAAPAHDLSLVAPPRTSSPAPSAGGGPALCSAPGGPSPSPGGVATEAPPHGGGGGVASEGVSGGVGGAGGEGAGPDPALERRLLLLLSDLALPLPRDAAALCAALQQ
ncbi:N6-adenosine-methyltransferase catalytic subunit-like, partial [Neopelma chrysocephalum]|uniref:N6-adenosine-methyltransferase catalytic subunit-like n=1 Tax=Neopelma chrysocephalum TaxID=114329 RepID=UPI000FCD274C